MPGVTRAPSRTRRMTRHIAAQLSKYLFRYGKSGDDAFRLGDHLGTGLRLFGNRRERGHVAVADVLAKRVLHDPAERECVEIQHGIDRLNALLAPDDHFAGRAIQQRVRQGMESLVGLVVGLTEGCSDGQHVDLLPLDGGENALGDVANPFDLLHRRQPVRLELADRSLQALTGPPAPRPQGGSSAASRARR